MKPATDSADRARADLRELQQRRNALRTGLILASVAVAFFIGVILKRVLFGG